MPSARPFNVPAVEIVVSNGSVRPAYTLVTRGHGVRLFLKLTAIRPCAPKVKIPVAFNEGASVDRSQ